MELKENTDYERFRVTWSNGLTRNGETTRELHA